MSSCVFKGRPFVKDFEALVKWTSNFWNPLVHREIYSSTNMKERSNPISAEERGVKNKSKVTFLFLNYYFIPNLYTILADDNVMHKG